MRLCFPPTHKPNQTYKDLSKIYWPNFKTDFNTDIFSPFIMRGMCNTHWFSLIILIIIICYCYYDKLQNY